MSSIELSDLKISKDSSDRKSKTRKAKMIALQELGKPPLAILEDLGQLTEEDFEILNHHEENIKEAIDKKVDIRQKIKDLDLLRRRLSQLIAAEPVKMSNRGPSNDVEKLKIQIKKEEDEIDDLLTKAILDEFPEEGKGKRKRKKTHKKSKKKHTKKHTKKHRKKHPKKHRKKHTKKNNLIIFTICIIKL
jgi:hypothetical protein